MKPLPNEHVRLTNAELYEMANRFLRPATKVVAKTIAKREAKRELPVQSRFVSPPCKAIRVCGPNQLQRRSMPSYVVWDGERERM